MTVAILCQRVSGHSGTCLMRCQKSPGCTEPEGHRRRCTTGTYRGIAWVTDESPLRCQYPAGTVERQAGGQQ
jgi:hypothetical protein